MNTDTQTAQKIVTVAMCVLTLAVSRRRRDEVLGVGYVVTSDPGRSREAHGPLLGHHALAEASPAVLRLVSEKLRERSVGPVDTGPLVRRDSMGCPWFDISVNESPHEIVMKIAKIYPIKA